MNNGELKKCLHRASELADSVTNPDYKKDAFKVLLTKFIDGLPSDDKHMAPRGAKTIRDQELNELAKKCDISRENLNDVILIKNDDQVEILRSVVGSSARKQFIISQIVLLVHHTVLNHEWVSATAIVNSLKSAGVHTIATLSKTLKKHPNLFISEGNKHSRQYKLTSGPGRSSAIQIIQSIARGDLDE